MGSPLLKELLVLAALLLVTSSLASQVQGQTKRLRPDTRRAVEKGPGRGNPIKATPVGGGRGTVHGVDGILLAEDVAPGGDGRGTAIRPTPVGGDRGTLHGVDAIPRGTVHGDDATLPPEDVSRAGDFAPVDFDGNDLGRTPLQFTRVQTDYIGFCQAEFLSEDVMGDGIISQTDFASTLVDLCEAFTVDTGAGCPQSIFSSLAVKLQLIFAFGICPDDDPVLARMKCLQGLANMDRMGMEIGYMVTPETPEKVQMDVNQLCFRLFQYSFRKFPVWKV